MNTQKALKVSKALIVLVLGIAWVLLKAMFNLFGLLVSAPDRDDHEHENSESQYDPLTDVNHTQAMHPEAPKHYFE